MPRKLKNSDVPDWSNAIQDLRRSMNLSQSEFGARLHYSAMAVSRWESGKQEPTSRCFIELGNMAGPPKCWMFWARAGLKSADIRQMFSAKETDSISTSADFEIVRAGGGVKRRRPKDSRKHQMVAVPLLGIQAGTIGQEGNEFTDLDTALAEEMIATPAYWCPNPVQTTCLRVKGTSMSPLINDGDVVAVDASQTNPRDLDQKIVVAWHRGKGLALARFVHASCVQLLESENHEYSPVTLDKDRKWQIVGKVLWWIRRGP